MKRPRPLGLAVVCALSAGAAGATSAVARADDAAPRWERSSRSAAVHVASTNRSGAKRSEDKAGGVLPQGQQRQRESRRERVGEPLHNVETVTRRLVNATATPAPTAAPTPTATVIAVATASASTSASTTHYLSASSSASATFTTSSNVDEEGDETSGMEQDDEEDQETPQSSSDETAVSESAESGDDEDDEDDDEEDDEEDDENTNGHPADVDDDPEGGGEEGDDNDGDEDGDGGGDDDNDEEEEEQEELDDDDDDDDDDSDDDSDSDSDDDESNETQSSVQVLTPADGDVLVLDSEFEVTWAVGDEEGTESTLLFHVDLYDCGNDQSCSRVAGGGACGAGDFVLGLCPEEGCYSAVGTASVSLPEVDGAGPYFEVAVSPDDGSSAMGCSGVFTATAAEDDGDSSIENDDDDDGDDEDDDPEPAPEQEEAGEEEEQKEEQGEDWCETLLGDIPYPLEGNLTVVVPADIAEISCPTPRTVRVAGGTLTVAVDGEAAVFSGVRFEVESAASLIFSTGAPTEFTGINDLQGNGGVLSVSEGGAVDMSGKATFRDNSIQGTSGGNSSCNGAAIYNEGTVHLRGGAAFARNFVLRSSSSSSPKGGDGGGALWNGPTGRTIVGEAATLEGNGVVGPGGRGGGLLNEGFVQFDGAATFLLNEAEGAGGGMFNRGGVVRFEGATTFSENTALTGSAFVNSAGGKVALHEETSIVDNLSQEEESSGSEAGAVWNQADSVVFCTGRAEWLRNRGYQAGAMLNAGKVVFRGEVSVQDNEAFMDGGGFINETGARIVFYRGAEFLNNVGTGYGGAILNHGELDFEFDDDGDDDFDDEQEGEEEGGVKASSFTLNFVGNYCGEQECQDIQNKDGSKIVGLHQHVPDLCDIGTQEIVV